MAILCSKLLKPFEVALVGVSLILKCFLGLHYLLDCSFVLNCSKGCKPSQE